MNKEAQLDAMLAQMPEEIVSCVRTHGFHKLAAAVYGLPDMEVHTLAAHLGTKIASQRLEWGEIVSGLRALESLRR